MKSTWFETSPAQFVMGNRLLSGLSLIFIFKDKVSSLIQAPVSFFSTQLYD
jgi:hypothetical protein